MSAEAVEAMLLAAGHEKAAGEADADLVIVNSCTVRDMAERKAVGKCGNLIAAKEGLQEWGRPIMLLTSEEGLDWLKDYSSRMPSNVQFGIAPKELMEGTMPRVMIADTFNRVFFKTEGYTIGLGDQILGALAKM